MSKDIEVITTVDLGLAAALSVSGYPLIKTEKQGNSVVFFFDKMGDITDACRRYFVSDLKVDALNYNSELKKLRKLISAHFRADYGEGFVSEKVVTPEETIYEEKPEEKPKVRKKKTKDGFTKL